jgi:hypothetical protein
MPVYGYVILIVVSWFLLPHLSAVVSRLLYPSMWMDFSFVIALALEATVVGVIIWWTKGFSKASVIPATTQKAPSNRQWLRILSFIYGTLIPPCLFIAMFAFGEPYRDFLTLLFSLTLGAMPASLLVACIGGLASSTGELSNKKKWMGRIFAVLPILNFLLFVLISILVGAT